MEPTAALLAAVEATKRRRRRASRPGSGRPGPNRKTSADGRGQSRRKQIVNIGASDGRSIEILQGVQEGMDVVLNPRPDFLEGERIPAHGRVSIPRSPIRAVIRAQLGSYGATTSSQLPTDTLAEPPGQWRSAHMAQRITWTGTTEEALALLHALRVYCDCKVDQGRTVAPCAGHHMLAHDQRAVDGLLFMRRMAARLLAEEFDIATAPAAS